MSEELAQPYSIEVEKERGGFRWKLRARGKLMVRSNISIEPQRRRRKRGLNSYNDYNTAHTERRSDDRRFQRLNNASRVQTRNPSLKQANRRSACAGLPHPRTGLLALA